MGSGYANKENNMSQHTCEHCHAPLEARRVTRLQEYQGRWVLVENLPALVCPQCGTTYYTPDMHDLVVRLITSQATPTRVESVPVFDAAGAA
jgi:YgiT-type zinc finger domain-containing protein